MIRSITTALFLTLAPMAGAQDASIEGTISGQIDAFKADDFATAFTFASPSIQNIFRTPENFGAMVRGGFPMVWRPSSVIFLDQREIAGRIFQEVDVQGPDGAFYVLDYQMIEIDGMWRINGVDIRPGRQFGA